MIFNSVSYLFFLSAAVTGYYILPGRLRWIFLVLASVAFYLSFIPVFFALIGILVIGNYFGGRWISRANEQSGGTKALTLIIILNILVLVLFKYFNFFFDIVPNLVEI